VTDSDRKPSDAPPPTSSRGSQVPPASRRSKPPPKPGAKPQKPPIPTAKKSPPRQLSIPGAAPQPAAALRAEKAPLSRPSTPAIVEQAPLSKPPASFEKEPLSNSRPLDSAPAAGAAGDQLIGRTIDGRYQVLELLGEGGMGIVYRCRRRIFENEVAVKILRSDFAKDAEAVERFVTEAKAASSIGHPHIVSVLDFGELADGSVYFAMEYLQGKTLGELIESGELRGNARMVSIARQVAEGLNAAHEIGIVHRDLKPENILVIQKDGGDFVKILDFGIAKVAGAQNKITRAGAIFGTPHYMSPEQCRGSAVEARSDIYALGVIMYELATGRPPFEADNPLGILSQHLNIRPVPPSEVDGVVPLPAGLEPLIIACLAKEPRDRPASMSDIAAALVEVERGEPAGLPVDISLASSAPPPPGEQREAAPSAPFLLSRRSLLDVGSSPSAAMPPPPSAPRSAPPATLTAIVEDSELQAFRKAQRGRRWPVVAGGVALVGLVALATHGVWLPSPDLMLEAMQAARPMVLADHLPAPPATAEPAPRNSVAIVLSPIDAKVYRGKQLLGTMPVSVDVEPGTKVRLAVKREGFWTRKVVLDGSKSKVLVRLAPIPGHRPKVPVPKQASAPGAGEAGDPAEAPDEADTDDAPEEVTPKRE
jgi:eukaryotic-like serine/threonine-protein kinase